MLIKKEDSCVVVVDMQEKLVPLVLNPELLVANAKWMLELACELAIPVMVTEQYPKGLGQSLPELHLKSDQSILDKTDFSCCADLPFNEALHRLNKKQVILLGIETHVCILQTALELKSNGFEVFILVDGVSSRSKLDHKMAIKRLRQAGCVMVTREMVFFEWLRHSRGEHFKRLSQTFIKGREDETRR